MAKFPILTLPLVKQSQRLVKKPMISYEFISAKDTAKIDAMMRKLWLLNIHGNGYMRETLRDFWLSGDNVRKNFRNEFNVVVARVDGMIVGAVIHEHSRSTVDTFVTKGYRRLGVATGMIRTLRKAIGDSKVLCGWTGEGGANWKAYYAKCHICWLDFQITKEDALKHGGDRQKAWESMTKSAKLKTSAAYRKSLKTA